MKKISLITLATVLASGLVSADMGDIMYNMMGGSDMMGGGIFGFGFLWLIGLAIGSFIFSLIFWHTYNLVAKKR